jgi:glycosyltransferase involved in cell wall biosynthesis
MFLKIWEKKMVKLSACVIALNEEKDIARCLKSLSFADEIVVVDSGSTDGTINKAGKYTDKVFSREFDDFSAQKNFAVDKASGEWILSVDADEVVTPELAEEIKKAVRDSNVSAYYVNRINHMYGRTLYHYSQPDEKIRLFRKDAGRFVQPVHEYVEFRGGCGHLAGPLMHYSIASISEHKEKAGLYTDYEVGMLREKGGLIAWKCAVKLLFIPPLRFFQNYIFMKGFREGVTGLLISFNSALVEGLKWWKCLKTSLSGKG